jgi:dTDP-glucose 4,6-dehydratase
MGTESRVSESDLRKLAVQNRRLAKRFWAGRLSAANLDKLTHLTRTLGLSVSTGEGLVCACALLLPPRRFYQLLDWYGRNNFKRFDRSIYDPSPAIETNVKGTFVLLQVAKKLGIHRFVHISTDEVYGDIAAEVFSNESATLNPSSPYSASKAASDFLVLSYVRTYGFPALITRSSNNYGPFQFPEKFLPLMITNALDNKPLPIYGDGKQQRDWLHVEDNSRGILAVLERGRIGEVYNLGGIAIEENLTMAKRLLRAMGKPETLLTYVKDRPGHDRRYALDCKKVETEIGWKPSIGLDEGLRQTIAWYEANSGWLAGVRGGEYQSYYEKYYENRNPSLNAIPHERRRTLQN